MNPKCFNALLTYVNTNTDKVHIVSSDTTDYAQITNVSLGSANKPTLTASDITGQNGRQLTFQNFTIPVTKDGTATHIVFVDDGNKDVILSQEFALPRVVQNTATITIVSEDIEIAVIE